MSVGSWILTAYGPDGRLAAAARPPRAAPACRRGSVGAGTCRRSDAAAGRSPRCSARPSPRTPRCCSPTRRRRPGTTRTGDLPFVFVGTAARRRRRHGHADRAGRPGRPGPADGARRGGARFGDERPHGVRDGALGRTDARGPGRALSRRRPRLTAAGALLVRSSGAATERRRSCRGPCCWRVGLHPLRHLPRRPAVRARSPLHGRSPARAPPAARNTSGRCGTLLTARIARGCRARTPGEVAKLVGPC